MILEYVPLDQWCFQFAEASLHQSQIVDECKHLLSFHVVTVEHFPVFNGKKYWNFISEQLESWQSFRTKNTSICINMLINHLWHVLSFLKLKTHQVQQVKAISLKFGSNKWCFREKSSDYRNNFIGQNG